MKSIGPYVVLREVGLRETERPSHDPAGVAGVPAPRRRSSHTLWAADRLTGVPVLLHPLRAIAPLPKLPPHPRLLPFTDMVAEMSHAYLVTELPPQTERARDPISAARGALEVLDYLHGRGLVHGSLDAAQLWEVGGQVRVSGVGLPRPGLNAGPADDLRDLAVALDDIGGLPPLLALLREAGDFLSARDMLDLLNVGANVEQVNEALEQLPDLSLGGSPAQLPSSRESADLAPLFGDKDIVLGGALADDVLGQVPESGVSSTEATMEERRPETRAEAAPLTSASAESPAQPSAESLPPFLVSASNGVAAPSTHSERREEGAPADSSPANVVPALTPAGRPRLLRRAGRQASERLKADHRRRLDLSILRRERTAAVLDKVQKGEREDLVIEAEPDLSFPPPPAGETPQERRRLEHQVWEEQQALDRELAAARRARAAQAAAEAAVASANPGKPPEIAEIERRSRSGSETSSTSASPDVRHLAPIRMSWGKGGERKVMRPLSPREELLRWLLPALGALVLAFAVFTLPRALRPAVPCCEVAFEVRGGVGKAALTLLNAPVGTGWQLGRKLGEAPTHVQFPAAGTYRIKLNADGYEPARVNVTVPTRDPVVVQFGQ